MSADGGKAIITSLTDGYYRVPYITDSYRAAGGTNRIGKFASVTFEK